MSWSRGRRADPTDLGQAKGPSGIKPTAGPGVGSYEVSSKTGRSAYSYTFRQQNRLAKTCRNKDQPGPTRYDSSIPRCCALKGASYSLRPRTARPGGIPAYWKPDVSPCPTRYKPEIAFGSDSVKKSIYKPNSPMTFLHEPYASSGSGPAKFHTGSMTARSTPTAHDRMFSLRVRPKGKTARGGFLEGVTGLRTEPVPPPGTYENEQVFGHDNKFAPIMIRPSSAFHDNQSLLPVSPGPGPGKYYATPSKSAQFQCLGNP